MKSKAAGCGAISTVISSIVLLCVSSITIVDVRVGSKYASLVNGRVKSLQNNQELQFYIKRLFSYY